MQNYTATFSSGRVHNQVKEFVVDIVEDLKSIDISRILPGSKAFVINASLWYMLDHHGNWQPVDLGSGGGGSGGQVIYDGGNLDDSDNTTYYDGGNMDEGNTSNSNASSGGTISYDGGEP